MEKKIEKNPVAKLREEYFERKRNRKPSVELWEILKNDTVEPKEKEQQPEKKIAKPKDLEPEA